LQVFAIPKYRAKITSKPLNQLCLIEENQF
jgi:hypothetical protein